MIAVLQESRIFPLELDSARAARHYVTAVLAAGHFHPVDEALLGDAEIVVTELAANAVLHARSAFTVTVARSPDAVRVAVHDDTPVTGGPPVVKPGHGLSVVAGLARRWGVDSRAGGKVVWAELPVASPSLAGRLGSVSGGPLAG